MVQFFNCLFICITSLKKKGIVVWNLNYQFEQIIDKCTNILPMNLLKCTVIQFALYRFEIWFVKSFIDKELF